MSKRNLTAAIFAATLFTCSAVAPAFAQQNGQSMKDNTMSGSKMSDDKMKGDKMKDDQMAGDKMGRKRKHKKPRKHKAADKMVDYKMPGNKM